MPLLQDAITKVTRGTVYYEGFRAEKEIATPHNGRNMLLVLKDGLMD